MAALGFTWVRVSASGDEPGAVHPGMYVLAAEVVAYLREGEDCTEVIDALERLQADNPPATTSGWVGLG